MPTKKKTPQIREWDPEEERWGDYDVEEDELNEVDDDEEGGKKKKDDDEE